MYSGLRPTGAYGANTCKPGFVWREALDGDTVCVTPDIRSAIKADNAAAASRVQVDAPKPTPQPFPCGLPNPLAVLPADC